MTWTARTRLNPNFINIYNRRCQCLDIQSFLVLRVTQSTRKLQRKLVNCKNTEIHRGVYVYCVSVYKNRYICKVTWPLIYNCLQNIRYTMKQDTVGNHWLKLAYILTIFGHVSLHFETNMHCWQMNFATMQTVIVY